jgi:uncharacterized protein (DUF885 family)
MADGPDIDALLDEFLRDELEETPVAATNLGLPGYDDRLGEFDAAAFARRDAKIDAWTDRFRAVGDEGLSAEQAIDRDLVLSALRGRRILSPWEAWRRNPDTYLGPGLSGVFTLFLHRTHPESELAASAAARLRAVPGVLDASRANLDPERVPPIFVQRAQGQCAAAVRYARELVPAEVADEDDRRRLAEAGEVAAEAYESFGAFLHDLRDMCRGDYAIGEEIYSSLLEDREMLGYGTAELAQRGAAAYDAIAAEMAEVARTIDAGADWQTVTAALNRDHPTTPEAMRAAYEEWTERARQYLIDHELVTIPEGERCLVEPSPLFQRPTLAVASYNRPPAFGTSRVGHFFVPFPPDGTPEEEVQQRLENNNFHSIPAVSVHEAYPGHHWHLVWALANGRPIRQLIGTPYFTEGWALYAELMMREQGFFTDPRQELGQLDARLFRAARIVVDTGLHTGTMTFEDAVGFMRDKASMSEPTARAEVGRYCSWPTQASSYLTGSLEIERMRERWFAESRGDLRQFHDRIAGSGMLPLGLAERALFA